MRRYPVGAEIAGDGVHFRVWAPGRSRVDAEVGGRRWPMSREPHGYWSALVPGAGPGARYRFVLDGSESLPDPASRRQPEGPHGPSEVVDPRAYRWRDQGWPGLALPGQVLYELHVGTFTPEGTWAAAAEKLQLLRDVGVTVIELMPIAEFAGAFGWGYDGVDPWAPSHLYGTPDDLRRFVDAAHGAGLGVILDVVYNHLGPDGNYLPRFAPRYLSERDTEWGVALNFDGPDSPEVRAFFLANAAYWIEEFHLDGFRIDATQAFHDTSEEHVLHAIVRAAREATDRRLLVIGENEPQRAELLDMGIDALWNDDFHHSAMVALTGRCEAYYSETRGRPQELISALKWGFLFQGQRYAWQSAPRGTPTLGVDAPRFVLFLQNHDQVANSARGARVHQLTSPGRLRAMTALLLLAPGTPLLFQGQEFGASTPFLYFADHGPELARLVREGRAQFLTQFPSLVGATLDEPSAGETFRRSKLDWAERDRNLQAVALHRDLLRLRREDPTFAAQDATRLYGAVLADEALVLRFFGESPLQDRLLVLNLGHDLRLVPAPEPLLAPPTGARWVTAWSSEDPAYGGGGASEIDTDEGLRIPGHAATVLVPLETP